MSQSLSQIYLHLVFSTKNRVPLLADEAIRSQVHSYLAGICRNQECPSLAVGGAQDHVHIALTLSRGVTVQDLLREIKRDSSRWINAQKTLSAEFHWQGGYGAFSVSPAHLAPLRKYIANQVEHHRKESFQDEFRRLLRKYRVDWDERYVWD